MRRAISRVDTTPRGAFVGEVHFFAVEELSSKRMPRVHIYDYAAVVDCPLRPIDSPVSTRPVSKQASFGQIANDKACTVTHHLIRTVRATALPPASANIALSSLLSAMPRGGSISS